MRVLPSALVYASLCATTIRFGRAGSGNGCTDNVTKLIEVPPSTVQQHTLPYRGGAVLPLVKARGPSIQQYSTHTRDVQSGAGIGHVVWLNDRRTRSFMQTVQRTRSRCEVERCLHFNMNTGRPVLFTCCTCFPVQKKIDYLLQIIKHC